MILNELDLLGRLTDPDPAKRIVVTPIADPRAQFGPTSLDIRLGTDFKVADVTNIALVDPAGDTEGAIPVWRSYQVLPDRAFILHPGEFALGVSMEFIRVPNDVSVRVEGRSSWGRVGLLIHATAGFVDPGFNGTITFELHNVSRLPIPLYPGLRIAQLCFFQGRPTRLPYSEKSFSKYSGKTGAFESKFDRDPEYALLRRMRHQRA